MSPFWAHVICTMSLKYQYLGYWHKSTAIGYFNLLEAYLNGQGEMGRKEPRMRGACFRVRRKKMFEPLILIQKEAPDATFFNYAQFFRIESSLEAKLDAQKGKGMHKFWARGFEWPWSSTTAIPLKYFLPLSLSLCYLCWSWLGVFRWFSNALILLVMLCVVLLKTQQ